MEDKKKEALIKMFDEHPSMHYTALVFAAKNLKIKESELEGFLQENSLTVSVEGVISRKKNGAELMEDLLNRLQTIEETHKKQNELLDKIATILENANPLDRKDILRKIDEDTAPLSGGEVFFVDVEAEYMGEKGRVEAREHASVYSEEIPAAANLPSRGNPQAKVAPQVRAPNNPRPAVQEENYDEY